MVKIREAIVVEGRYDKNTLSQIVEAPILETSGFGIFKDKQQMALLRKIAQTRGLIVFTDSDGAGFVIRNYLKSALPTENVFHAYIPDVPGKEKRKAQPGKEGKLGVEGMDPETLRAALRNAGAVWTEQGEKRDPITKTDLFLAGLSGGKDSSAKRKALQKELLLPEHLGANAFLQALNLMLSREEFLKRYGENYG